MFGFDKGGEQYFKDILVMILFPFQRPFPLDAGFAGSLAAISKVCSSKKILF